MLAYPSSEPTAVVQTTSRYSNERWPQVIERLVALIKVNYYSMLQKYASNMII